MEEDEKTVVYAIIAACVFGIIIVGALVIYTDTSEGFSELYFEDHTQLPRMVILGHEVKFKFTVVSHEKEPVNYTYDVTFDKKTIVDGSFTLQPQGNETINVALIPRESSLVFFDVPLVEVISNPLLKQSGQISLPISGASDSAAMMTLDLRNAEGFSYSFNEIRRVGNPDNLSPTELDSISTLGYIVHNEVISVEGEQPFLTLKHFIKENEYRYQFKKISVEVLSEGATFKDGNTVSDDEDAGEYEIHFWVIVMEDPANLLGR
jgi:hypothetical protein